jgi:predicted ATP-grasp superfamily ATP-dependent carboligase
MPKVLVLDAQMRNSLAVIRALGKGGLKVDAGEETRFATGFFSRYCEKKFVYPNPSKNTEEFINYLLDLVKKNDYEMIFPITDSTVLPIVLHKGEFSEHTIVPFPNYTTLIKAMNKENTIRIAMANKIPLPKTYFLKSVDDSKLDGLEYPIILKPVRSSGSRGVALCNNNEELIDKYKYISGKYGPLLAQEYIPQGGEVGVYTLFNEESKPIALSVQKRIRSYPVSGGPSTLRETVKNEELAEISFKLLRAMNWYGLAMVEFRIDARNGKPKLMEINPRFWGSLQLSILAGVNFPYLLYRLFKEGSVDPVLDYAIGTKCRWILPGDILWYLSSPNKIKNSKEFFRFDISDDIISYDDPGPTAGFMMAVARYLFDLNMWKFVLKR